MQLQQAQMTNPPERVSSLPIGGRGGSGEARDGEAAGANLRHGAEIRQSNVADHRFAAVQALELGANLVSVPASDIYVAMERGTIGGTILSLASAPGYKLRRPVRSGLGLSGSKTKLVRPTPPPSLVFAASEDAHSDWEQRAAAIGRNITPITERLENL